ncbi:MAG: biotin/lipoyl-binding protein [Clostridiales bacterium]|nr:biotin/lipoyl-binding protein [Clostridiales bacterium]
MRYVVSLNNKRYEVDVDESSAVLVGVSDEVVATPAPVSTTTPLAQSAPTQSSANVAEGTSVKAPMPGSILSVNVTNGQSVKQGDVVVILEAMKMENEILAPSDGVIKQVLVSKGNTVDTNDILVVL